MLRAGTSGIGGRGGQGRGGRDGRGLEVEVVGGFIPGDFLIK